MTHFAELLSDNLFSFNNALFVDRIYFPVNEINDLAVLIVYQFFFCVENRHVFKQAAVILHYFDPLAPFGGDLFHPGHVEGTQKQK